jgi:predicted secreted protein
MGDSKSQCEASAINSARQRAGNTVLHGATRGCHGLCVAARRRFAHQPRLHWEPAGRRQAQTLRLAGHRLVERVKADESDDAWRLCGRQTGETTSREAHQHHLLHRFAKGLSTAQQTHHRSERSSVAAEVECAWQVWRQRQNAGIGERLRMARQGAATARETVRKDGGPRVPVLQPGSPTARPSSLTTRSRPPLRSSRWMRSTSPSPSRS